MISKDITEQRTLLNLKLTVSLSIHTAKNFIIKLSKQWLLLETDGAVYHKIQSTKTEYGEELSWLIPFSGNWHCLKNYQKVLMKIYYDAGLHELAVASGYPPSLIKNCTIFSRTHDFLLEPWESFYQHFVCIPTKHFQSRKFHS